MKKNITISKSIFYVGLPIILTSCSNERNSELPKLNTEIVNTITQIKAKSGVTILSNGGAEITEKGVCWGEIPHPTLLDSYTSDGSGSDDYESTLIGLIPDTEYHVRAYAINMVGTAYGDEKAFSSMATGLSGQIIANHTVVDKFDDIPQEYINKVREMWLVHAGESHSLAVRNGLLNLETLDPKYAVSVVESGTPEAYTTANLRASRATWGDYTHTSGWIYSYGEEDWFSNTTAPVRTKAGITYCNTNNLTIGAIGFGWCWDPPIYTTSDFNMYIDATDQYIAYCTTMGYPTKIFFTTGTVDIYYDELGYEKYLGNEMIRDHVDAGTDRILFDYADILCYDEGSESPNTYTWNGHTYPIITDKNLNPVTTGHISAVGSLRLAKAMWWMLARITGWDGK